MLLGLFVPLGSPREVSRYPIRIELHWLTCFNWHSLYATAIALAENLQSICVVTNPVAVASTVRLLDSDIRMVFSLCVCVLNQIAII